ncbi:MAG: hypothetical protein Q8R08_03210 [bacterium]|nr:hypothetical protein [bacterium]
MSWVFFAINQAIEQERREKRTRIERFKRLLAALPQQGLCLTKAVVKEDWIEQWIMDASGMLIGSVGYNSDKTSFVGIAYVKDSDEPNPFEALWLKLNVDPYQLYACNPPER